MCNTKAVAASPFTCQDKSLSGAEASAYPLWCASSNIFLLQSWFHVCRCTAQLCAFVLVTDLKIDAMFVFSLTACWSKHCSILVFLYVNLDAFVAFDSCYHVCP